MRCSCRCLSLRSVLSTLLVLLHSAAGALPAHSSTGFCTHFRSFLAQLRHREVVREILNATNASGSSSDSDSDSSGDGTDARADDSAVGSAPRGDGQRRRSGQGMKPWMRAFLTSEIGRRGSRGQRRVVQIVCRRAHLGGVHLTPADWKGVRTRRRECDMSVPESQTAAVFRNLNVFPLLLSFYTPA